jgi:NAD-dependent deacetylase
VTPSTDTDFVLDAGLDAEIARAGAWVAQARHAVALTGAGLSVESGIPPFRGPGGIWTKYGEPPMDGYQRFLRDPAAAWRERLSPKEDWMRALGEAVRAAKPNPGHLAFAELERRGMLAALITQNIDDLHRQAGHENLLEIHGNHRLLRCIDCNERFDPSAIEVNADALPPRCPHCSGIVKGDIVQFGEPIPPDVLRRCFEESDHADCMLVVGTSATVYPAAQFPYSIRQRGGHLIELNPYESELTPACQLSIRANAGDALPVLAARLAELRSRAS